MSWKCEYCGQIVGQDYYNKCIQCGCAKSTGAKSSEINDEANKIEAAKAVGNAFQYISNNKSVRNLPKAILVFIVLLLGLTVISKIIIPRDFLFYMIDRSALGVNDRIEINKFNNDIELIKMGLVMAVSLIVSRRYYNKNISSCQCESG